MWATSTMLLFSCMSAHHLVFVIGNTNFANNDDHQKHSKKTHLKNSARTAAAFSSAPRSSPRRTRRPSTFYGPIFDRNQKVAAADSANAEHFSTFTSLLVCAHAYHSNYPLARTVCVLCPVDIENWVSVRIFTWIPLTLVAPNGIGPLGRMNLFK